MYLVTFILFQGEVMNATWQYDTKLCGNGYSKKKKKKIFGNCSMSSFFRVSVVSCPRNWLVMARSLCCLYFIVLSSYLWKLLFVQQRVLSSNSKILIEDIYFINVISTVLLKTRMPPYKLAEVLDKVSYHFASCCCCSRWKHNNLWKP